MTNGKRRLLWVGDAGVHTGFATVTHNILDRLGERWKIGVLGVNYRGDPHTHDYPMWPAALGGDVFGFGRIADMVEAFKPDVVCINSDLWVVSGHLSKIGEIPHKAKLIAYIPIDTSKVARPVHTEIMSVLDFAIFYTKFGEADTREQGLKTKTAVIPHGVDLNLYKQIPKEEARRQSGLWELVGDKFVFGNVNRNQPRKRFDLTIRAFGDFLRETNADAYLYMHCNAHEAGGWNLQTLTRNFDIPENRVLYPSDDDLWRLAPEEDMPAVYSSLDCHVTTPIGEGWGLTVAESMACYVPNIVPDHSAFSEWVTRGAIKVHCSSLQALTGFESNGIGAVIDHDALVEAMITVYRDKMLRRRLAIEARDLVEEPQFRWENIAMQFDVFMSAALGESLTEQGERVRVV